jgi:hypothetical protein
VSSEGSFFDEGFAGCFTAYSDDYLFWSTARKVRAYAFAVDGRMPVRVCEMAVPFGARGMAVHQRTGTLLVAGSHSSASATDSGGGVETVHSVNMIDIRPPPADWKFVDTSAGTGAVAVDRLRFASDVIGVTVDEDRGFVYVLEHMAQRITQFTAGMRTTTTAGAAAASSERKSPAGAVADAARTAGSGSTVSLTLTVRSVLDCRLPAMFMMSCMTVLSASELLVFHHGKRLSVCHIATAAEAGARRAQAEAEAEAEVAGSAALMAMEGDNTALRPIAETARGSARSLRVDEERRYVFLADYEHYRVTVHDLDSDRLVAELPGASQFVELLDGVLLIVNKKEGPPSTPSGTAAGRGGASGGAGGGGGSCIDLVAIDSFRDSANGIECARRPPRTARAI